MNGAAKSPSTILWRRLDSPGHDACRLVAHDDGWRLEGFAAFLHEGVPAAFAYTLDCDPLWRTRSGRVTGWVGARSIDLKAEQSSAGGWTLNGQPAPQVGGCVDLDFGFTPATNLAQLRRIGLPIGKAAAVPVAWLDITACSLDHLQQRYERRDGEAYWYEAPRFGYAALLGVNDDGFIVDYPGLWKAEEAPRR